MRKKKESIYIYIIRTIDRESAIKDVGVQCKIS